MSNVIYEHPLFTISKWPDESNKTHPYQLRTGYDLIELELDDLARLAGALGTEVLAAIDKHNKKGV